MEIRLVRAGGIRVRALLPAGGVWEGGGLLLAKNGKSVLSIPGITQWTSWVLLERNACEILGVEPATSDSIPIGQTRRAVAGMDSAGWVTIDGVASGEYDLTLRASFLSGSTKVVIPEGGTAVVEVRLSESKK
jgi:hypothetical protein